MLTTQQFYIREHLGRNRKPIQKNSLIYQYNKLTLNYKKKTKFLDFASYATGLPKYLNHGSRINKIDENHC